MAYLKEKIDQIETALVSWRNSLEMPFSDISRDAAIRRYEYSFELLWKVAKVHLKEKEGIDCFSPKSCFRELRNILKISEEDVEICIQMSDDLNLSVHTYSEKMANGLHGKLKSYLDVSEKILSEIRKKIAFDLVSFIL